MALLEVQAPVRRLLRRGRGAPSGSSEGTPPLEHPGGSHSPGQVEAAVAMARYMADYFREPIAAADVARAVRLTPTYAMTVFRRTTGCTIGAYPARCWVAEAQRPLVLTRRPMPEVADASGFSS